MQSIILVGGGGHCRSVIDVIEQQDKYKIEGIIDMSGNLGKTVSGYEIIGTDNDIEYLVKGYRYFFITIGQIITAVLREKLYKKVKSVGGELPVIVSPHSYVSRFAQIGEGTIIMNGAIINSHAKIGKNCIINSNALIEHDAIIGNNTHVATGAIINGGVNVGDNSFIGSGAVTKECIKLSNNIVVGAGVTLLKDQIKEGKYVKGVYNC